MEGGVERVEREGRGFDLEARSDILGDEEDVRDGRTVYVGEV